MIAQHVIDFDALYPAASGKILIDQITKTINQASPGDTIIFRSKLYDFEGQGLLVNKGVVLCGVTQTPNLPSDAGAGELQTTFKNVLHINMFADHTGLKNLQIEASNNSTYLIRFRHSSYNNTNVEEFYHNITVTNVCFKGSRIQVFAGNGAELYFQNVSFLDYTKTGFSIDRHGRVDFHPKIIFKKCLFRPDFDSVNYDVRGISMDAGNEEYPEVWDENGTLIDSCKFDGTGIGFSKTKNVIINNNHFLGYRMDVDMIHLEEFTNHILIENNLFEYVHPARGLNIDREGQPCFDIRIQNNTFIGNYGWIISAYSPYNLQFFKNDLSATRANNPNAKVFDFTYLLHEQYEHLPGPLPARGIYFGQNKLPDVSDPGILSCYVLSGDTSVKIEDYPESKIILYELQERPTSFLDTTLVYQIRNLATKEWLTATEHGQVIMKSSLDSDNGQLWRIKFIYPYFYAIQNFKTGNYLEVYKGFTYNDYYSANPPTITVEQKYNYEGKKRIPIFYLQENPINSKNYFEVFPGGNERKSRWVQSGKQVILEFARESPGGKLLEPNELCLWEFVPVMTGIEQVSEDHDDHLVRIFPNPFNATVKIRYYIRKPSQVTIEILNSLGQRVLKRSFQHHTTGLKTLNWDGRNSEGKELASGVYLVRLTNSVGKWEYKIVLLR